MINNLSDGCFREWLLVGIGGETMDGNFGGGLLRLSTVYGFSSETKGVCKDACSNTFKDDRAEVVLIRPRRHLGYNTYYIYSTFLGAEVIPCEVNIHPLKRVALQQSHKKVD
jgi:hypothetical protein